MGCLWCSESLGLVLGRFFPFLLSSCRTPCSMSGQGSGKTPQSEAQDCRFLVVVQFRPADALLSPESGIDQGTLFARNVVQDYVRACMSSFFLCVVFVLLCFFGKALPPLAGL